VTQELTDNPDLVAGYQENFDLARNSLGDVTAANVDDFDAAGETAAVSGGLASNTTLTTGNDTVAGDDGFADVVTGTVGTGATLTSGDSISGGSGAGDVVNLSGDGAVNLDTPATGITGFETINLDLEKQQDNTAFAVTGLDNDVTNLNITVAEETEVVGITVSGEQTASVTGNVAATIDTTNVTELTITNTETNAAFAVTGDSALATLTIDDANDAGVTITMDNETASINVGGADGTNDAATISAPGAVALDTNDGTDAVELLTLSGNGAAVTYTMADATSGTEYTITGDQDVTLSGANDAFDGNTLTDSSTGSTTVKITSGGSTNLEDMGVLSGGVNVAAALTAGTLTVAAGNTVTLSADQTAALTIDGNDTTAGGTLDLVMSNDSSANITFADYETVSINSGANAASVADLATGTNDTLNIAGTSSFTANNVDAGSLGVSVSGDFTANDVTSTFATGDSSISITADTVDTNDIVISSNDALDLTSTNEVDISTVTAGTGTVTIDAGTSVVTGTIGAGAVDATAGTSLTTGTITTSGTAATVSLTGGTVLADPITSVDVTIEATNDSGSSTVDAITATGDLTFNGGSFTQGAAGAIAVTDTLTLNDTTITIANGNDVSADSIVITGDGVVDLANNVDTDVFNASAATNDVDAEFDTGYSAGVQILTGSGDDDITANNDTIFSISTGDGNDAVTLTSADTATVNTGDGIDTVTVTVLSGTSGAASTITTGDGGDTVTVENGVGGALTVNTGEGADTVTANDVSSNITINLGAGDDSITTNDATATDINADGGDDTITLGADSDANVDGGDGTDTLVLASNDYSDDSLVISGIEKVDITAGNEADISASTFSGDNTFELVGSGNLTTSFLTISAETASDTTINASGVTTGVVTAASVNIDGNDGDDVLTHNAYSGTISGGAGNDTISGNAGQDTIDGGTGADTMTGGADADTFTFGSGDNDIGIDAANDSMDTITDFVTGSDSVTISDFTGNWAAGGNEVDGSSANDVGEVLTLANDTLNGSANTQDIIIVQDAFDSGDTYVYIDADNDGMLDDNDILIIFEDATPVSGDFGG
jgi:Ca2+-binding RTX toxin-like protein